MGEGDNREKRERSKLRNMNRGLMGMDNVVVLTVGVGVGTGQGRAIGKKEGQL